MTKQEILDWLFEEMYGAEEQSDESKDVDYYEGKRVAFEQTMHMIQTVWE